MQEWEQEEPLIIERGKGPYLIDTEGKRYLDGTSSIWVNLHGHRHPTLDRAIKRQLDKVAHSTLFGLSNPPAIQLARALIRIAPKGLTRVFYSDNGSTAVEVALKMAVQYWQQRRPEAGPKHTFLHLKLAYHGDTIGAVSVGNIELFHSRFKSLLFPTAEADPPYCYRCPLKLTYPSCQMACLDPIEQILKERHRELAGFIIEPLVQAAAGMLTSPPGYLKRIRELCTKYNVLLIADEVATGFGRTGKMFACQHEGVTPDLMAISKGLTGGYMPLAATLTTDEIYQAFLGKYEDFKTFFHGHSYTGNPLGCAVALANLEVFKKDKTLAQTATQDQDDGATPTATPATAPCGRHQAAGIHGGHRVGGGQADAETLSARRSDGPSSHQEATPRVTLKTAGTHHGAIAAPLDRCLDTRAHGGDFASCYCDRHGITVAGC